MISSKLHCKDEKVGVTFEQKEGYFVESQAAKVLKCPSVFLKDFLKIHPLQKCLNHPGGFYRSQNIPYHQPIATINLSCFIGGQIPFQIFPGLHLASTLRIPSAGRAWSGKAWHPWRSLERYDKTLFCYRKRKKGPSLCNNCCSFQSMPFSTQSTSELRNDSSWWFTTMKVS